MLSPRSACIPRLFAENNQVYQVCSSCAGIQSNCNQNSVYVLVRICSDTLWGRVGERLLSLRPIASVKTAVAYGFGYVVHLDVLLAFQVGDGACHLEYAAVGTCRELQAFHGPVEVVRQPRGWVWRTVAASSPSSVHCSVCRDNF